MNNNNYSSQKAECFPLNHGGGIVMALMVTAAIASFTAVVVKMSKGVVVTQIRERKSIIVDNIANDISYKLMYGTNKKDGESMCTLNFKNISLNTDISGIKGVKEDNTLSNDYLYKAGEKYLGIKITKMTISCNGCAPAPAWSDASLRVYFKNVKEAVDAMFEIPLKVKLSGASISECQSKGNEAYDNVMKDICENHTSIALSEDSSFINNNTGSNYSNVSLLNGPDISLNDVTLNDRLKYDPITQSCKGLKREVINRAKVRACSIYGAAFGEWSSVVPGGNYYKCKRQEVNRLCPIWMNSWPAWNSVPMFVKKIEREGAVVCGNRKQW